MREASINLSVNWFMHRDVAKLLEHRPASPFRDAIIREVIARSAKHLFRLQIGAIAKRGQLRASPMEDMLQRSGLDLAAHLWEGTKFELVLPVASVNGKALS